MPACCIAQVCLFISMASCLHVGALLGLFGCCTRVFLCVDACLLSFVSFLCFASYCLWHLRCYCGWAMCWYFFGSYGVSEFVRLLGPFVLWNICQTITCICEALWACLLGSVGSTSRTPTALQNVKRPLLMGTELCPTCVGILFADPHLPLGPASQTNQATNRAPEKFNHTTHCQTKQPTKQELTKQNDPPTNKPADQRQPSWNTK